VGGTYPGPLAWGRRPRTLRSGVSYQATRANTTARSRARRRRAALGRRRTCTCRMLPPRAVPSAGRCRPSRVSSFAAALLLCGSRDRLRPADHEPGGQDARRGRRRAGTAARGGRGTGARGSAAGFTRAPRRALGRGRHNMHTLQGTTPSPRVTARRECSLVAVDCS